ncbi:class I SAM-dependent methyltransferase [Burkholderia lata]|uniref:class I SAM-dependent methyltransferase n=1 Tax=Burkholderia lata (strain ATCC 17760 / DSM 23089 / LMG 22485 / NCIMB 9086 / R18194 / 383) TaxID=482957 RepID=UPI001453F80D|nr:class I SAM-dependent methyltransferase [Burkholderia lata]VWM19940.1 Ubiquinone biosynthesis O-methyltransferase [Burkholderia lata]
MEPTQIVRGYCHVCGSSAIFKSYEPIDFPCKRNSFLCENCGSSARNRHIAKSILDLWSGRGSRASLGKFAKKFRGTVFVASTTGAIVESLAPLGNRLVVSEYVDGAASGEHRDGKLCEDIQATSFDDCSFDLVITEDVLEHVPHPDMAFAEIRRILKPGGYHVATIPVKWHLVESEPRAIIKDGVLHHLQEPEFHLDPTRAEGILAFTDYGQDILTRYCSIIGRSEMLTAHGDLEMERAYAIYNNWIFLSQREGAAFPAAYGWTGFAKRLRWG